MSGCIKLAANDTCLLGFYCPNSDADHPPEICQPSTDCAIQRSHGFFCIPQGPYEPHVCKPGYYCPPGGKQQIKCPTNTYCPIGSFKPETCELGTFCPGEIKRVNPIPAYVALALDIFLFVRIAVTLYKSRRDAKRGAQQKKDAENELQNATDGATELEVLYPTSCTIIDTIIPRRRLIRSIPPAPPTESEEAVLRFIRRARAETGLDFEFSTAEGQQNRIARGTIVGVIGPGKKNFTRVLAGLDDAAKYPPKKPDESEDSYQNRRPESGVISVHINGHHEPPKAFRRIISVVPREGVTTPHLTVRENILHAARMRLPNTFSREDINTFVDALITHFKLSDIETSYVGSSQHPVISDAQRHLVSIAMALAAGPTAIFLEEPTAHMNLDEAAALFRLLKFVSDQGVTCAITMNQPTRDIWNNIFLGPGGGGHHTPCAYPYTPGAACSPRKITQLKVAAGSGDRFPWYQQL